MQFVNEFNIAQIREQLCPTGVLRAAINMTNGLLVTGAAANGDPSGVSPDMAAAIANELNVELVLKPYPGPGFVADALASDEWDIGNIAAEPERAKTIWFSPSYCEIQATYLVSASSTFLSVADIDVAGVQIAAKSRAAYELWLRDNLKHAALQVADSFEASRDLFVNKQLDALAGLRPALLKEMASMQNVKLIDESFTAVQQSIGCKPGMPEVSAWLTHFVQRAISEGDVQALIEKHDVTGRLSVSPLRA